MAGCGYIKLYRGWRDTDGLIPPDVYSDWDAWLWLLENAAWKEISRWNAKGEEIRLQPGQIHVSLRSLSTAWGWSKSKVERFLARLERVKKAGQLPGQSGIILTIENWAKYQASETDSGTASGTASGQPRDTQEERKERKEGKKIPAVDFPEWVPLEAWGAFVSMRRSLKKPMSEHAEKLAIGKLRELRASGQDITAVLNQSVFNSWQGLFPVAERQAPQTIKIGI